MASNINPYNIDGTYPIAGQDNSSQGFRDNFTNIKNNLTYAQQEISDLQAKALLKSALTGGSLTNNMAGTVLQSPQLLGYSETFVNKGNVGGAVTIDFSAGNYQQILTTNSIALVFSNFPATGSYGAVKVLIQITDPSYTVTLPVTNPGVTQNVSQVVGLNATTGVMSFDVAGYYVFEFSTVNNGQDILIRDLTRNANFFNGGYVYYNPAVTNTLLVGYGPDALNNVLPIEQGQDTISSYGSMNSVGVGNLTVANVTYNQMDTGGVAGYSISSARGNLALDSILPVRSNDYLGYVNAITLTGNANLGNVFQQVAGIGFYATGSNVTYGLGGNIAFYTADDGGQGANRMNQAMGIENNQSTKFFGNVITSNVFVPTSSTTAGGVKGQITYDSGYVYVCIGPGNWKRSALTTF